MIKNPYLICGFFRLRRLNNLNVNVIEPCSAGQKTLKHMITTYYIFLKITSLEHGMR